MSLKIHTRPLLENDFDVLRSLLLTEAPNQWNYITEDTIHSQFVRLKQGEATAALLEDNQIVGFSIMLLREACPVAFEKYEERDNMAYIEDVVVSKNYAGRGHGTQLLLESMKQAHRHNIGVVYIERHEENLASAGMMRKAGFEIVETFNNPEKRTSGSRRTVILKNQTSQEIK